jgi:hypothetical protein
MKSVRWTMIAASMVTAVTACGGVEPELEPMTAELAGAPKVIESVNIGPAELAQQAAMTYEPQQLEVIPPNDDRRPDGTPVHLPCPMGLTPCDGDCVDLSFDPANCGACGFSCATPYCAGGRCVDQPPPWVDPD